MTVDFTEAQGTFEPFVTLRGKPYTRDQTFSAFHKAQRGEALTQEEADLAGACCVHPVNGPLGLAPYAVGHLLMSRQKATAEQP